MFSPQGSERERLVPRFPQPATCVSDELLLNMRPQPTLDEVSELVALLARLREFAAENSRLMDAHRQEAEALQQVLAETAALEGECERVKHRLLIAPYAHSVELSSAAQSSEQRAWRLSQTVPAASEAVDSDATMPLTTLLVQNLPQRLTQDDLLNLWPPDGTYDFLHVPRCIRQRRYASYAFLNFTSPEAAAAFRQEWDGEPLQHRGRSKRACISLANIQGLDANMLFFMRSDERMTGGKYVPALFDSFGRRLEFREASNAIAVSPGVLGPNLQPAQGIFLQRDASDLFVWHV